MGNYRKYKYTLCYLNQKTRVKTWQGLKVGEIAQLLLCYVILNLVLDEISWNLTKHNTRTVMIWAKSDKDPSLWVKEITRYFSSKQIPDIVYMVMGP